MPDMVRKTHKTKSYWIQYIQQRIKKNKNFLGIFTGPTGSGKSWAALSVAAQLNEDFNVDRCVFKGKDLMRLVNDIKYSKRKGVVIIWDESGIDLSNRNWQSSMNKLLNFLLQTFRHRCFILIFTTPYTDFVDAATRKLFHAEFSTVKIDFNNKKTIVKPKLYQYNSQKRKFYEKYLRVSAGGGVGPLQSRSIAAPPKELVDKYEEKKTRFTSELNEKIQQELAMIDQEDGKELTDLQKDIVKCWEEGITTQTAIAEKLGKVQPNISRNIGFMRRKGHIMANYAIS